MKGNLSLKEIIWEITGQCKNGCSYCGSKHQWNEEIDEKVIKGIAYKISLYPPEEIDISGGDPLLISYDTHKEITSFLKKCIKKILVNPKSLKNPTHYKILKLYDWAGISINTEEELNLFKESYSLFNGEIGKECTIISNFNTTNLYMFDYIKEFVKSNNLGWQVQLTMTDIDSLAIYKSDLAFKTLTNYIQTAMKEYVNIILADNLNNGCCSAGTNSLGILSNGDVVPCLSMRSWNKEIDKHIQGNLAANDLKEIWETKFRDCRFNEFKSCKEHCGNKTISTFEVKTHELIINDFFKNTKTKDTNSSITCLYAVRKQPFDFPNERNSGVMAYAVQRFNSNAIPSDDLSF